MLMSSPCMGQGNPLSGLLNLPPGWQVLAQTPVAPTQYLTEPVTAAPANLAEVNDVGMAGAGQTLSGQSLMTTIQPVMPNQTMMPQVQYSSFPSRTPARTQVTTSLFSDVQIGDGMVAQPTLNLGLPLPDVDDDRGTPEETTIRASEFTAEIHGQQQNSDANTEPLGFVVAQNEEPQEEDIRDQLLGVQEDDFAISTPLKRKSATSESEDPFASLPKKRTRDEPILTENARKEEGFSVDRVAVNSLVDIMISVRDCLRQTNPILTVLEKAVASNSREIHELSDSVSKLRKSIDDKEKEDRRREERRLNWERKQDENARKEREDNRRREERRMEAERKERGERRRQEEKEKENSPPVKSVLGRSYTENTIQDINKVISKKK